MKLKYDNTVKTGKIQTIEKNRLPSDFQEIIFPSGNTINHSLEKQQ